MKAEVNGNSCRFREEYDPDTYAYMWWDLNILNRLTYHDQRWPRMGTLDKAEHMTSSIVNLPRWWVFR